MIGWLKEAAELVALVAGAFVLSSLLSRRVTGWSTGFRRRRWTVLTICAALIVLAQVSEEVLGRESDAVDKALLLAVHAAVPASLMGLFDALTVTASAVFIMPAVGAGAVLLLITGRRRDALQLVLTTALASAVIYVVKTSIGRTRPALWDTQWYWGSSFPSGHTLTAAAVATCLCLLALHARVRGRAWIVVIATLWVAGVGLSRLVLGVHWPTDVIAAAAAGLLVAVMVDTLLRRFIRGRAVVPGIPAALGSRPPLDPHRSRHEH
ncbi:MAG: phosphatase PAP2 family protein [Lysobacter sp.]|nr:MAG: phosphatase PAP2 family protein [Lysobacter sp.]